MIRQVRYLRKFTASFLFLLEMEQQKKLKKSGDLKK
jgi:hypothetical protein